MEYSLHDNQYMCSCGNVHDTGPCLSVASEQKTGFAGSRVHVHEKYEYIALVLELLILHGFKGHHVLVCGGARSKSLGTRLHKHKKKSKGNSERQDS